jgi:hypothetical protein
LKSDAEAWAVNAERAVHHGKAPDAVSVDDKTVFSALIELHIKDMAEVGRPTLRSKALCLEKLKSDLGREKLSALTRERLITYGKARAKEGAGPAPTPLHF